MVTLTSYGTLAEAIWPRVGVWPQDAIRNLVLIAAFTTFVVFSAQIAVHLPWTTVPITGQTFAVLVTGGALGAWRGASSLTLYLLLGMVGIPVFAPGSGPTTGGWEVHFILPWSGIVGLPWELSSGGYIVGFIFAAGIVGYLAEKHWDRKPWVLLGMFLGNVVLYIPGILWLAYLLATDWVHPIGKPLGELIAGSSTWDKALKGGLYPFIVGDFMKLFLASLALPAAWSLVQIRGPRK